MAKNIVVDASVFLSRLLPRDPNSQISKAFFEKLKEHKIVIFLPIMTIFEILHAFFRVTKEREATDKLYEKIIDWNISKTLRIVNIESSFLVHFTALHYLFDIKTADATIAVTAHHLKFPLITWDKQLLKAAKKHVQTMTPEQFLKR